MDNSPPPPHPVLSKEKRTIFKFSQLKTQDNVFITFYFLLVKGVFDDFHLVVRCPFREEHLAVCRNFFFVYMPLWGRYPIMSCHITSHHIPLYGGLLVAIGAGLGQMVCSNGLPMYKSIWHLGQDVPSHHVTSYYIMSHPPYLSNCWRYRLGLGLVGKVFESTFQILKNGISMATSLATRCKTPWQPDANG